MSTDAAWLDPLCGVWRTRQRWVLAQQLRLARIAAPTGDEHARGTALERRLTALPHLRVHRDGVGNVCAVVQPACPRQHHTAPLVCFAHLDSVLAPSAAAPIRSDGVQVAGPGVGDNGRGLAAMMALGHALGDPIVQRLLTRPVHLVATVGEEGEGNLRGATAWFDARETPPHAVVVIDGPGDEHIVHHAVGSVRLRLSMHGAGGHSWAHAGAPNPIHALGALVSAATSRERGLVASLAATHVHRAALTVTRTGGGESLTGIPTSAWVDVDLRAHSALVLARLEEQLTRLAHRIAHEESLADPQRPLTTQVRRLGARPAGAIDAMHPLVQAAGAATRAVGRAPRSATASTDANVPLARGVPAVAIGAGGRGGGAHTLAEWYDDTDASIGLERVLRLVLGLATAQAA